MKKLLLTSAIVAVAGAAAAEITWSGEADISWRSHEDTNALGVSLETVDNGLTIEGELTATGSAELDNGITASISYGINMDYSVEGNATSDVTLDDFPTITLESSVATLTIGDVETSYVSTFGDSLLWEADGELVATVDTTVGPAALGVSYVIDGGYGSTDDGRIQLPTDLYTVVASGNVNGIKAALGVASVAGANDPEYIIGVMAGYELNGIDVALKYQTLDNYLALTEADFGYTMANGISLGLELDNYDYEGMDSYMGYEVSAGFEAMGADITLSYGDDNIDDNVDGDFAIDAAYEVLPGLTVLAGYDMGETTELEGYWGEEGGAYVATTYDLGGGASVYASWADYEDAGDAEYEAGAQLGLALTF